MTAPIHQYAIETASVLVYSYDVVFDTATGYVTAWVEMEGVDAGGGYPAYCTVQLKALVNGAMEASAVVFETDVYLTPGRRTYTATGPLFAIVNLPLATYTDVDYTLSVTDEDANTALEAEITGETADLDPSGFITIDSPACEFDNTDEPVVVWYMPRLFRPSVITPELEFASDEDFTEDSVKTSDLEAEIAGSWVNIGSGGFYWNPGHTIQELSDEDVLFDRTDTYWSDATRFRIASDPVTGTDLYWRLSLNCDTIKEV